MAQATRPERTMSNITLVMQCQEAKYLHVVLIDNECIFSRVELAILLKGANHVRICTAVHDHIWA